MIALKGEAASTSVNPFPQNGELNVLFAGHSRTFPLHKVGPKVHDYFLVHAVTAGKGTYDCLDVRYELEAGDCFFIFPGELVVYCSDDIEPWRYRWIGFNGSAVLRLLEQIGITPENPVIRNGAAAMILETFAKMEGMFKQAEANCDLAAGGLFRLALAEWMVSHRDAGETDLSAPLEYSRIEHAVRWLKLQYMKPITIEGMARELGYHRTHLSKMFKQQIGMPPVKYLLKLRMERAKTLLAEPLTVEQVAYSVGFTDPLYFSRQFKSWHGCSPSEFRNEMATKKNPGSS